MREYNLTKEELMEYENALINSVRRELFSNEYVPECKQFEVDQKLLDLLITDKASAELYFENDVKKDLLNSSEEYESLTNSIVESIGLNIPDELFQLIAEVDAYYQNLFDGVISSITMEDYLDWCQETAVEVKIAPDPYDYGFDLDTIEEGYIFSEVGEEYLNNVLDLLKVDKSKFGEELASNLVFFNDISNQYVNEDYVVPSHNQPCVEPKALSMAIAKMASDQGYNAYLKVNATISPAMLYNVNILEQPQIIPEGTNLVLYDSFNYKSIQVPLIKDLSLSKGKFDVNILSEEELYNFNVRRYRFNSVDYNNTIILKKGDMKSINATLPKTKKDKGDDNKKSKGRGL